MRRRRVLLVGWDSADWRIIQPLIDAGKMPVLAGLIERGVSGRLASLEPMISPLLWTSIVTGKRAPAHGIYSFTATDAATGKVESVGSHHRKCHALWNILHHEGYRAVVCNWFASHPAEPVRGLVVSNEFAAARRAGKSSDAELAGSVYPAEHRSALSKLRVEPGDIDESVIRLLVPRAEAIDQTHDLRLARLAVLLAENFTVHAAFTFALQEVDWDFAAVYYEAIDAVAHHFMRYVLPLMPGVRRVDAEIYGGVVEGIYRLHDAMLGRLLALAGDDATLCLVSDHGFHSHDGRPAQLPKIPMAITRWHRRHGILVLHGPDMRRDTLVHGAGLLDIAPTILTLFGIPLGDDMAGRVLTEAFTGEPTVRAIPTWENISGDFARVDRAQAPLRDSDFLQRLVELGYLAEGLTAGGAAPPEQLHVEQYFRALALLDANRSQEALPILDELHELMPERDDIAVSLGNVLVRLGLLDEGAEVIDLLERTSGSPAAAYLRADLAWRHGDRARAIDALALAEQRAHGSVQTLNFAGTTYLHLREVDRAERVFLRSLALERENPGALGGLSFCRLRQGRYDEAAALALEGIGLLFHHFYCHYCYGIALAHLGDRRGAIRAFENTLRFNPRFHAARRYLVPLLKREPGAGDLAEKHRGLLLQRALDQVAIEGRRRRLRDELNVARAQRAARRVARRAGNGPGISQPSSRTLPRAEILIVSGLPRSGTSLAMQLLEAGGVPVMIDNTRAADISNPFGYYEWERIKYLPRDPFLIGEANGRAVKVVSPLLRFLPAKHRYRVIVMRRDAASMVASQNVLRARLAAAGAAAGASSANEDKVISDVDAHIAAVRALLTQAPNVTFIEIDFELLLAEDDGELRRFAEFCQIAAMKIEAMKSVIRR
jgi:predicted AlkP superfamily phosphohydrolase/phosphomutase/tetratricopeptide (TPR) repeat protein